MNRFGILSASYAAFFVVAPFLSGGQVLDILGLRVLTGMIAITMAAGVLDVVNDLYGKARAREVVVTGAVVRLVVWGFLAICFQLPVHYEAEGFRRFMHGSFRILVAGEVAMFLTQYFLDIPVFDWFKRRFAVGFWARYNASNAISQTFNTSLFVLLGLWGTPLVPDLRAFLAFVGSQMFVRLALPVVLTPVFSLLRYRGG